MRKILVSLALVAGLFATQARADVTGKDASAATVTWFDFICFTTKHCPAHVNINSAGTEVGTSGAPLRFDPTGTTTQPVSGTVTSNVGTGTRAISQASGSVASGAYSSGAFSSGAFASGSYASGAFASGSMVDLLTVIGSKAGGTAAASSMLGGGVYNTSAPTLTNGQQAGLQLDVNGNQKVTVVNTLAAVGNNADGVAAGAGAGSPVINYNYLWNGTTWDRQKPSTAVVNPCESVAQSYATGVITSATTTRIIAPSASNKTYLCVFFTKASAADNVAVVEGTGGTCGTGTAALLGGTTTANGLVFSSASDGVMLQAGGKVAVIQTAGTNVDTCLITSTAGPLIWSAKYVQAP